MYLLFLIELIFSFQQSSTVPVAENQNSMGGEDMEEDSNNNHEQATFPKVPGGFNFTAPAAGMYTTQENLILV